MATFAGNAELAERKKITRLRPTEKDVEAAFGSHRIRRKYRPDGSYEWRMPFRPNDGQGKHSHDGQAVMELMRPFWRADSERHSASQARTPRAMLKDKTGSAQYVEPEKARETADRNGWHSPGRIVGILARGVVGDYCERCDRLHCWCECPA